MRTLIRILYWIFAWPYILADKAADAYFDYNDDEHDFTVGIGVLGTCVWAVALMLAIIALACSIVGYMVAMEYLG